ncbi:MAG: endolytic transglycosylase MltG [Fusobacteriaceae bacterium]
MKKLLLGILTATILSGAGLIYSYQNYISKKINYNTVLEVSSDKPLLQSLKKLPYSVENYFFRYYIKERNGGKAIKAGYYELVGEKSLEDLITQLEEGRSKVFKLTIPEGFTYKNVMNLLTKGDKEKLKQYELALKEIEFPYPTPNMNFEGYFYPETYYIPENYSIKQTLEIPLKQFLKVFPPENYPNKEEFYQKLIMASILEREAMRKEEKSLMASVFYNRIEKKMTLSSDATVNYIYNYEKRRIYYKDLEIDSPYNTYKYRGLPPGPIANPHKSSLDAAYNPDKTDYLFFVTSENGYHFFSRTYREHLEFQKNNKK